jgi:hypothetical protein
VKSVVFDWDRPTLAASMADEERWSENRLVKDWLNCQ